MMGIKKSLSLGGLCTFLAMSAHATMPKPPLTFGSAGQITCNVSFSEQYHGLRAKSFVSVATIVGKKVGRSDSRVMIDVNDIQPGQWTSNYGTTGLPTHLNDIHSLVLTAAPENKFHLYGLLALSDSGVKLAFASSESNDGALSFQVSAKDITLSLTADCNFKAD